LVETELFHTFVIEGSSHSACPLFTTSELFNFVEDHKFIFSISFGLIGLFICIKGNYAHRITFFLIVLVTVFILSMILVFTIYIKSSTEEQILIIITAACGLISMIIAYLSVKWEKGEFILIGGFVGAILGLLLY